MVRKKDYFSHRLWQPARQRRRSQRLFQAHSRRRLCPGVSNDHSLTVGCLNAYSANNEVATFSRTIIDGRLDVLVITHYCPRPGVLQVGTVSLSVSKRPRSTVPVALLRPARQCCHSAASAFRQPSATCSTSLPSRHLRLPCLFSRRPHSLELSPGFHPGPDHQCRVFQTFA